MQRRNYGAVGSTATINGQTLSLTADLTRQDRAKKRFDLSGAIKVNSASGPIEGLDLVHFSLRPARAGYYVQNFVRTKYGLWRHVARRSMILPKLTVDVSQHTNDLQLRFAWPARGGVLENPEAYNAMDVSVTLVARDRKRHTLSLLAVPVKCVEDGRP